MILGLPPLLGFIPILLYIVLMIMGKNMVMSVLISVVIGGILTGVTLLEAGGIMFSALGSFLALIGFIIMLGAGLGEVLTRTKVARNIVRLAVEKANIKTQTRAMIVTMLLSTLLVGTLGTLAGANAILAPIIISVVASLGITPSTLGVLFHGAGAVGLMAGPFVPPVLTILGLTGISYAAYLREVGIPFIIIVWTVTFAVAKHVQKKTAGVTSYGEEDVKVEKFYVTPQVKRGTAAFVLGMAALLGFGIWAGTGASYAVVVMLLMSFIVGIASGLSPTQVLESVMAGCSRFFHMFFMFVLFQPLMGFLESSGALVALMDLLAPVLSGVGQAGFLVLTTLITKFGISGAAVAQSVVIHEMFGAMAQYMAIPMTVWAMVLMVSSQFTSFAYPNADMMGQMGISHSKDLKSMMKNGISLTVAATLFVAIRGIILAVFGV